MSVLLETSVGDLVIDLDVDGSPDLARNFLKLVKARYYTGVLVYNVQENRYCQMGDPKGDGTGGCSIFGLLDAFENNVSDVRKSTKRFLKATSKGAREITKEERRQKGIVTMVEIGGIANTIGSQFLITLNSGPSVSLDNIPNTRFLSLGRIAEDGINATNKSSHEEEEEEDVIHDKNNSTLDKINALYCDTDGRPYQDVRIIKALNIYDPFPDPENMDKLLHHQGVILDTYETNNDNSVNGEDNIMSSPQHIKPLDEIVSERISHQSSNANNDDEVTNTAQQEEHLQQKEEKSRAIVLEMLGDLPSAEVKLPETILFVCQLNSITQEEDLELIFSRFDSNAKVELIRDRETGDSLQYAFVEFTSKEQCTEAFLKMNNALVDDRRIKVDFSQSVGKEWNKYTQQMRRRPSNGMKREDNGFRNQYNSKRNDRQDYTQRQHQNHRQYHNNNRNQRPSFSHPAPFQRHDSVGQGSERHRNRSNDNRGHEHRRHDSNDRLHNIDKRQRHGISRSRSRSRSYDSETDDSQSRKLRRKHHRHSRSSKHRHSDKDRKHRHKHSKRRHDRHKDDDDSHRRSRHRRHHHRRDHDDSHIEKDDVSSKRNRKHRRSRSRSRSHSREERKKYDHSKERRRRH